jgi:4-amino-4-deoxy-L-arabinose transferase-like glycosyltransferase
LNSRLAIKSWVPVLGVTLIGLGLRFWRLGDLALIGDESYYWLWSRTLDWSYYDHPAGVALLVRASTALGGENEAGIRWLNALFGTACIPMAYLLGAEMISRRAGLFAAGIVAVGAPYLLTSRFVYTDAIQLFLLLVNLYWAWRVLSEKPRPRPITVGAFGLSLALLFNTKYNAYLYVLALGAAILIDHRRMLTEKWFWLAGLVAAFGLLPVLGWNMTHDWISFRWQLAHLSFSLGSEHGLLGSLYHSLAYLSWPIVVLALLGLGRTRSPAERLLSLVALVLLLPVALSPANSPRNLSSGLVALFLLAGARGSEPVQGWGQRWMTGLLAVAIAATAIYGVGTVANLFKPSPWPHSTASAEIRRDASGWRELGPLLSTYPELVFALDYSIASQIWYYSGRPAYTSWGQYLIWGVPAFHDAVVIGLNYLPDSLVTQRLRNAFDAVDGPRRLTFEAGDTAKEARIWQAERLQLDQETFLQAFDFLTLLEASR